MGMLTERMQIQAIVDELGGVAQREHPLSCFKEPWRTAYRAVIDNPNNPKEALRDALRTQTGWDDALGTILAAEVGGGWKKYPSLRELAEELPPITWLWEGWIPNGMLSLLGAVPGAGKSFMALDLARRIIEGDIFPDGTGMPRPGSNVVYVDAEAVPQITNERAKNWDMNTDNLFLMLPEQDEGMIDFTNQKCKDQLVEMTYNLEPALIIIDSLSSISSRGENSVEDVREVLAYLSHVAVEFECGMLLIHHLRKRAPLQMLDVLDADDFRGSSHIVAMARSVIALSIIQDSDKPNRNGPRRVEIVKTNLATYPEPIGFEILPGYPEGVILQYGEAPQPYKEPTKVEACMEWLVELLDEEGPMKPKDVVAEGKAEGFSRAVVYQARNMLTNRIDNAEGRKAPHNKWELRDYVEDG